MPSPGSVLSPLLSVPETERGPGPRPACPQPVVTPPPSYPTNLVVVPVSASRWRAHARNPPDGIGPDSGAVRPRLPGSLLPVSGAALAASTGRRLAPTFRRLLAVHVRARPCFSVTSPLPTKHPPPARALSLNFFPSTTTPAQRTRAHDGCSTAQGRPLAGRSRELVYWNCLCSAQLLGQLLRPGHVPRP